MPRGHTAAGRDRADVRGAHRDLAGDPGAVARSCIDAERAAQKRQALGQVGEPGPAFDRGRVEAGAIVGDDEAGWCCRPRPA